MKQVLLFSLSINKVYPFECCYCGIWFQSTIVAYFALTLCIKSPFNLAKYM